MSEEVSKDNFSPQVVEVTRRLLKVSDSYLKQMIKNTEQHKSMLIVSSVVSVSLFLTQIATPFPWLLIPTGFLLLSCFVVYFVQNKMDARFKLLKEKLHRVHDTIEEILPLHQQDFVRDWQWERFLKRQGSILKEYGIPSEYSHNELAKSFADLQRARSSGST